MPALRNGFVNWDDDIYVVANDVIRSPTGLRQIWSTTEMPEHFPNYPLVFTSYWMEYRLWGESPAGYHATNVLLHAANTALVFALALMLGASPWVAGVTAALFGLHPLQVESVVWVTERKNVLSAFFALLAMLAYLQHRRTDRWWWYAVTVLAFALALLSKTAVATLPLSMLLADRLQSGRWTLSSLSRIVPLLLLAAIAGLSTLHIENLPLTVPLVARPLLAAGALCFYAGMLLVPWNLMPIYPRWDVSLAALRWWLPLIGLFIVGAAGRRWALHWRIRWGVGHFVCLLLPVLGLRPFGFNEYSFVADHHVYLASIGFFLALAEALGQLHAARGRIVTLLVGLALACLLGVTEQQIVTWRDSVTLWSEVLARNPAAPVAHNNLGLALIERGDLDNAAEHLRQALAVAPNDPEAHTNLGLIFYRQGQLEAAEEHCRRALATRPGDPEFHKNLALVLQAEQRPADAANELRAAMQLRDAAVYHYLLGNVLIAEGQVVGAIAEYERALARDPGAAETRHALGRAFLATDRLPEAAASFTEVVRQHPEWAEPRYNLALALRRLGRVEEAKRQLDTALQLRPDFDVARQELDSIRSEQNATNR